MPSLAERWYKQGKEEGIQEGIHKGKQQGIQEGKQLGIEEGIREGLYEAIELGLQLKFGNDGKKLFRKVKNIEDIGKLREIKNLIKEADSIKEIEKALKG